MTHDEVSQGVGPYTKSIKTVEEDIQKDFQRVNELAGACFDTWHRPNIHRDRGEFKKP